MGSIDETGPYREKRPKIIFSSSMIYEYGNSQLAWNLAQDMYKIIAMAMVKAIDPLPLRLVASRFQKLYVSRKFQTDLDPDDLSNILGYVGNHFPDLYELFRK